MVVHEVDTGAGEKEIVQAENDRITELSRSLEDAPGQMDDVLHVHDIGTGVGQDPVERLVQKRMVILQTKL